MTPNPYDSPTVTDTKVLPAPLPVRARGVLTPEDARQALNVAFRQGSGIVLIATAVAVVVLFAGAALLAFRNPGHESEFWPSAAALTIVGSFFIPMYLVLHRRRFARMWNSRAENQQPVTWTFSADGLLIETASGKQLQFWSSFIYALTTTDKLILAQQGGMQFNFVPRRFFETEEDWAAVRQLLAEKLPVRDRGP
jgi:hypothetical protein